MAKRYFFCNVVGTGTDEDPLRAQINDHVPPVNSNSYIPDGFAYALCVANVSNQGVLSNLPNSYLFPQADLDVLVGSIDPNAIQNLRNELDARGIASTFFVNSDPYRTVIYGVGQRMAPGFVLDSFDCAETENV